jgi:enoyl-CoA hydratase
VSEHTSYLLDGGIAMLRIDDGKVNVFSVAMLKSIHAALDRAEDDGAVVIITGRPGYLSAGFDLGVFAAGGDPVLEMLSLGARLVERVLSFPRPVVVACSGHAVAAGAFMPLAADARIAADGSFKIGLNEVQIGLTLPQFVIELARQRLQPAHFDRAVVSAAMYSPRDAVTAGFLDEVVAAERLQERSVELAESLATLDPAAHTATKLRARGGAIAAVHAAIEQELGGFAAAA